MTTGDGYMSEWSWRKNRKTAFYIMCVSQYKVGKISIEGKTRTVSAWAAKSSDSPVL